MKRRILAYTISILIIFNCFGCSKNENLNSNENNVKTYAEQKEEVRELVKENKNNMEYAVEQILKDMTLDEKVYQMMFVQPEAITKVAEVVAAGDTTKAALESYPVGGIITVVIDSSEIPDDIIGVKPKPGGGFDASVDEWGDEINADIII